MVKHHLREATAEGSECEVTEHYARWSHAILCRIASTLRGVFWFSSQFPLLSVFLSIYVCLSIDIITCSPACRFPCLPARLSVCLALKMLQSVECERAFGEVDN